MRDRITGRVVRVVDGDTFIVRKSYAATHNAYNYNTFERVRLSNVNAPELSTWAGRIARQQLIAQLLGAYVNVNVAARDRYGRVIGRVNHRRT